MTKPEDALPVVAWAIPSCALMCSAAEKALGMSPGASIALVRQSDTLSALTLVQQERDAAFALSRCQCSPDEACKALAKAHAERNAMQQERDELRAALRELLEAETALCPTFEEGSAAQSKWASRSFDARRVARAALTPKATQPTSEASRGR